MICVDRRTGKTLWQQMANEAVPHEGHHPDGSFASASPMTDGKNLYVSFGSRGVYCFDLEGNPKWSRDLGRMKVINKFGEGSSPVVYGDTVIVNWDHQVGSFIIALDAKTGETQWKVDRDESSTWATPLVVEQADRMQVMVSGSKRVRSYDLKTGELIWACGGQTPSAIPCPVSDGKNVYCHDRLSGQLGVRDSARLQRRHHRVAQDRGREDRLEAEPARHALRALAAACTATCCTSWAATRASSLA